MSTLMKRLLLYHIFSLANAPQRKVFLWVLTLTERYLLWSVLKHWKQSESGGKMNEIYTRGGSARRLNGCHVPCWKKGPVDVDDWSYDNDRWCFLEPCGVLLRCQWHWGLALNASDPRHRTTMKVREGGCGRDNPVTHIPSKLLQHWAARGDNGARQSFLTAASEWFWTIGWSVFKAADGSVLPFSKTLAFPSIKAFLLAHNQPDVSEWVNRLLVR